MKKTIILSLFLIGQLFYSFAVHAETKALTYKKIVIFGDSLSDNGNFYSRSLGLMPKSPPYYKGRFSNGEVWSDRTAAYFKKNYNVNTENFAVGGAVSGLHFGLYLPWSLYESVNSYLLRSFNTDRSSTLYVIWISGNDYLDGADNVDAYTSKIIGNIKYSIETLIGHGAKQFLLISEPDLSKTPYSKQNRSTKNLFELTEAHNRKLRDLSAELTKSYSAIHLEFYDVNLLFKEFIAAPERLEERYGVKISNVESACWSGGYLKKKNMGNLTNTSEMHALETQFDLAKNEFTAQHAADTNLLASHSTLDAYSFAQAVTQTPALKEANRITALAAAGVKPCGNPDNYLFWDKVHPSAIAHKMIAQELLSVMEQKFQDQNEHS
jgi:phospholipase/lecithinase/hemolysin